MFKYELHQSRRQSVNSYLDTGGLLFYMPLRGCIRFCACWRLSSHTAEQRRCTLWETARTDAISSAGGTPLRFLPNNHSGLLVCLQRSCRQDPPLGRSGPHKSSAGKLIIISSCYEWVIRQNITSTRRKKKKRHGSFHGCSSRATVFILSTAPNAQCVYLSLFLTSDICTPWQYLYFIKSKVLQKFTS